MKLGVEMTMDASRAERAVAAFTKKSGQYFGSIGSELTSRIAGAFAAGAVISSIETFVGRVRGAVDEIKDLGDQLGLSTDEVQKLQKAANDAGVKFGVITNALQRIESLKAQAASGDKSAQGIFSALGIDANLPALTILEQAIDKSKTGAAQNAAAFDLLGKKVGILANIVGEMRKAGPISLITKEQIADIDAATASLEEANRMLNVAGAPFLATGIRGFTAFLESLRDVSPATGLARFAAFVTAPKKPVAESETSALPATAGIAAATAASMPAAASVSLGSQGDALSRIGLFVGGRPEVGALRNIEASTRQTAEASRQTVTELRTLADVLKYYVGGE